MPLEDAPGFEQIELHPCFIPTLGSAKGSMQTVRGQIDVEWHMENGKFVYTVTLPEGITAKYNGQALSCGRNQFIVD